MPIPAGTRVGAYEIVSPLGRGGMGEVYRARDAKLGRDVAIKVLPAAWLTDPDRRARFEREARLLATVNHPHIGGIYGAAAAKGRCSLSRATASGSSSSPERTRTRPTASTSS